MQACPDAGVPRSARVQDQTAGSIFGLSQRRTDPMEGHNQTDHVETHEPDPQAARLQRRRRLHELVLALIGQQGDLELLDGDALLGGGNGGSMASRDSAKRDPASWLDHNRRLIQRYQALVRTAATLDALIDQEVGDGPSPSGRQP